MPGWDVAVPTRPLSCAMAGFSARANDLVDVPLVPHPAVMVVFDLGDRPFSVQDGADRSQAGSVVAGLASRGVRARGPAGSFECLQVRLPPAVAHAVLGAPGDLVALDDLWGRAAGLLRERLRAAASWDERFSLLDAALVRRLDAGRTVDPEVAYCWQRMVRGRGRVRVERLADEAGWSRKRLWSRFRAQIGLTPKRAAQLVRFDHAAHRLAAGHGAAAVAADGGYADQSHLHRDVMTFAGATPSAVARAPFLAVDPVAWPAGAGTFVQSTGGHRAPQ